MLLDEIAKWNELYSIPAPKNTIVIALLKEPGGIGDAISLLPAFRHLKKMNPQSNVIFMTFSAYHHLFKRCKYIDRIIDIDLLKSGDDISLPAEAVVIEAECSFKEHHKDNVLKSNIRRICQTEKMTDVDFSYEIEIYDHELPQIDKTKESLLKIAAGRKIIGISPAYTMFSRIWQTQYWEELTNLLQKEGYCVVSLGHEDDLYVKNVDHDGRGEFNPFHIPSILDIFETIFVLNSGMMHIAAINQNIHIVLINVGQFPAETYVLYRHGQFGHKTTVVEHSCSIKDQCYQNHLNETSIHKQGREFLQKWIRETGRDFPETHLLLKYICWHYCDKETDKYECSRILTPQMVFDTFKQT